MKLPRFIAVLPLLLASCGSDAGKNETAASAPQPRKSLSQRVTEENGFKKDANGNWVPLNDRRSPFESKGQSPNFAGKEYKKTEYKTGDYARKSWWGTKEYDRKAYAGNTDGSRFQKASDLQGKGAREAGAAADVPGDYKTEAYATTTAREASEAPIKKGSNDAIENRRKVFQQPEIVDWREQRNLSMDQSKGILGR